MVAAAEDVARRARDTLAAGAQGGDAHSGGGSDIGMEEEDPEEEEEEEERQRREGWRSPQLQRDPPAGPSGVLLTPDLHGQAAAAAAAPAAAAAAGAAAAAAGAGGGRTPPRSAGKGKGAVSPAGAIRKQRREEAVLRRRWREEVEREPTSGVSDLAGLKRERKGAAVGGGRPRVARAWPPHAATPAAV